MQTSWVFAQQVTIINLKHVVVVTWTRVIAHVTTNIFYFGDSPASVHGTAGMLCKSI